ncbi:MAG TPA: adenylyl-sulfate kinase [Candidatus Acidoferrum sp.]|nr:adenylyl-sulfate kinase [Candidatus Acidoferrum sp.]
MWTIWITGLPGSGKSVLARAAGETLRARGVPVKILELDALRKILTPTPTYSDHEREAVYRLLAFMAATLAAAGVPVIVDATAHRRRWREFARELIPRFAEVQLECPLAVAREREAARAPGNAPPAIYARAGSAGATVPGVDRDYERALQPELIIGTTAESVAAGADQIITLAEHLGAGASAAKPHGDGWAIWITGRPGSGKTTIAQRLMTALAARGIRVWIVEATAVRRIVWPVVTEDLDDLVHRAVVCLATMLVEAGIAVIVDATAHHRRWRELARELIPRFAEIQLACPSEICADRERAARWHLTGSARGAPEPNVGVDVDLVLDYEPALCPELTIYTDVQDCATAVADVLFVAERFHRPATHLQKGRPPCE